jgi:hypothetical protein
MRDATLPEPLASEHRLRVQLADLRLVERVVTRRPAGDEGEVLLEELFLPFLVELERCGAGLVRRRVVAAQADRGPGEDGGMKGVERAEGVQATPRPKAWFHRGTPPLLGFEGAL